MGILGSQHWRPEGALFYPDWSIAPQGARYRELVYDEWWTDADVSRLAMESVEFDLFAGEYEITVDGVTHSIASPRAINRWR